MAETTDSSAPRKRVAFAVHAPDAQSVSLVGDFNGWDPAARPLRRDDSGTWKTTMTLPAGEYEYRFFVDGNWVDDPKCDQREPNQFGSQNCIRVVG